ncbi:MAG: hypothetical protein ACN2B6_04770 [Rickettsiales bacterium]
MATESFEELPMPRKDVAQLSMGSYRIYKNAKEFVTVQASSAIEALQTSGVKSAYKIERDSFDHTKILGASDWGDSKTEQPKESTPDAAPEEAKDVPAEGKKETVLVEEAQQAEAAKEVSAGEEKELSGDDVDKLLNN